MSNEFGGGGRVVGKIKNVGNFRCFAFFCRLVTKLEFKENEENFQKTMEAAREISKKANELAKQSSKK